MINKKLKFILRNLLGRYIFKRKENGFGIFIFFKTFKIHAILVLTCTFNEDNDGIDKKLNSIKLKHLNDYGYFDICFALKDILNAIVGNAFLYVETLGTLIYQQLLI